MLCFIEGFGDGTMMLDEDSAFDVTMAFAVKFYNPLVKYNGRLF